MTKKKPGAVRGRPWTNVKALARQHTAHAFERLVELVDDPNGCVAVAAARVVLDRAYGKVPIPLKHEGKPRKLTPVESPLPEVKITRFTEENGDAG